MSSFHCQFHARTYRLRRLHKLPALLSVATALLFLASCTQHAARKSAVPAAATTAKPPRQQSSASRTIKETRTISEQRVGIVRAIGARGGFVLIETPSASVASAIPAGHLLHCHPAGIVTGSSTADLRVSPERRQPFVIADVLAGVPSVGDVAYLPPDTDSAPVSTHSIIPLSSLIPSAGPTPPVNPTP